MIILVSDGYFVIFTRDHMIVPFAWLSLANTETIGYIGHFSSLSFLGGLVAGLLLVLRSLTSYQGRIAIWTLQVV